MVIDTQEATDAPQEENLELRPHCAGQVRHVLVCLDGSALGEMVLPHAITVARSHNAQMTLLRVLEEEKHTSRHEPVDPLDWEMRRSEATEYLERVRERVASRGVRVDETLAEGHAAEQILGLIAERGIDLVAISSHGEKGLEDWMLSGTAEKVLAQAGVSVLLVPSFAHVHGDDEARYRRVVVPLDCSPRAECVFGSLLSIVEAQESEILLAHALPLPALTYRSSPTHADRELARSLSARNEQVAADYLERTKLELERKHVKVRVVLDTEHDARDAIEELVHREKADLIAMTAHGTTASSRRRYGGVARDLISRVKIPLLVIQDLPVRPHHRDTAAPRRARKRDENASRALAQDSTSNRT